MKLFVLIVAILFSASAFSKYPSASFDNPRQTMNYFLKTMKGYKLGDLNAIDLAIKSLNTSKLDPATKEESARLAATRIINTLDRLEYIDVNKIPDSPEGEVWYYKKHSVEIDGIYQEVEIAISKIEKKWLFTPETINSIVHFETSLKNKKLVKGVTGLSTWKTKLKASMPEWTGHRSFVLLNGQWLAILLIIFISLIIEKIVRFFIGRYVTNWLIKRNIQFEKSEERHFTLPIGIMTFSGFWTLAVRILEFQDGELSAFLRGGYVVFTIATVFAANRVVDVIGVWLSEKAELTENKYDDILVPLISKTSKFFVFCIGLIFIGNSLTLDMKSIIAGMGIGGFAFAFAAKDTIANLFGSLTILLDKPFQIGDLVNIGGNIEGVIEQVGIRSTRVRTLYDSMITVPNGILTNTHIDNYGRRNYRRLKTTLGVQYDTKPEKLEAFCEGIRELIRNNENVRQDNFRVYFNSFNASSLDILIYLFWHVPSWDRQLEEEHKLSMDILKMANEMGVSFAFPTRTLHLFNESSKTT